MLIFAPALILSTALLLALILVMTLKPAFYNRLNAIFLIVAVMGGILFYGTGFMEKTGELAETVVRTTIAVLRMFLGVNELAAIDGTILVSTRMGRFVFWLLHLIAFASIASAVFSTLGSEALRHLRYLLSLRGDLTLLYGINENSLALGKECLTTEKTAVVFIDENAPKELVNEVNAAGMAVLSGLAAASCSARTMRRLHLRKRKLSVYALHEDEDRNLFFALRLRDALKKKNIPPERTRISLPGAEDIIASMLQVSKEQYGFGYVNVFDACDLTARALIRTCPPWESVHFGDDGHAQEDYTCVIVGFGSHGQAVLKQLVMNGQFAGAKFHAAIFSNHFKREAGYLLADSPELLKEYDIQYFEADARGRDFYHYIEGHLRTLKLIAICTGETDVNREISDNLMLFLKRRDAENICVVQCGDSAVRYQEQVGSPIRVVSIYTREYLSAEQADYNAMLLNATYDQSERSTWEKWVECDSFSKMSSRASADFIPAFLRIAGMSREEVLEGNWHPSNEFLQVLGETEHLRWNAFHFAMGYRPMSREEFESNAETWKQCEAEGKPCGIKIAKNSQARTHACLIPWDELDELSKKENRITGRNVNYKQIDIDNVLTLPKILQAEEKKT